MQWNCKFQIYCINKCVLYWQTPINSADKKVKYKINYSILHVFIGDHMFIHNCHYFLSLCTVQVKGKNIDALTKWKERIITWKKLVLKTICAIISITQLKLKICF